MITLRPRSLVVFAPSYAIARDCLRVDHDIDPSHPALAYLRRISDLRGWLRPIPLIVVDPFAERSLSEDSEIYHLRRAGSIRDWTDAERAAVSLSRAAK